jgi:hypothetical protein
MVTNIYDGKSPYERAKTKVEELINKTLPPGVIAYLAEVTHDHQPILLLENDKTKRVGAPTRFSMILLGIAEKTQKMLPDMRIISCNEGQHNGLGVSDSMQDLQAAHKTMFNMIEAYLLAYQHEHKGEKSMFTPENVENCMQNLRDTFRHDHLAHVDPILAKIPQETPKNRSGKALPIRDAKAHAFRKTRLGRAFERLENLLNEALPGGVQAKFDMKEGSPTLLQLHYNMPPYEHADRTRVTFLQGVHDKFMEIAKKDAVPDMQSYVSTTSSEMSNIDVSSDKPYPFAVISGHKSQGRLLETTAQHQDILVKAAYAYMMHYFRENGGRNSAELRSKISTVFTDLETQMRAASEKAEGVCTMR